MPFLVQLSGSITPLGLSVIKTKFYKWKSDQQYSIIFFGNELLQFYALWCQSYFTLWYYCNVSTLLYLLWCLKVLRQEVSWFKNGVVSYVVLNHFWTRKFYRRGCRGWWFLQGGLLQCDLLCCCPSLPFDTLCKYQQKCALVQRQFCSHFFPS